VRAALAQPVWPWVVGLVLGSGLISMVALTRTGSLLFFRAEPADPARSTATKTSARELAPTLGLLVLCLILLIWAGPILELSRATAGQLLHPQGYVAAVLGGEVSGSPP
jgi:multicomponent K+:H+ antiporter subunit D